MTDSGEFGGQSPIKGRVIEVDTDPTDIPETSMVFVVNDSKGGRKLMYAEREDWASVSVVSYATPSGVRSPQSSYIC